MVVEKLNLAILYLSKCINQQNLNIIKAYI